LLYVNHETRKNVNEGLQEFFSYIPKYKKLSCYQNFTGMHTKNISGTRVAFFFDYRLLNQKRR